jgi:hypothetical protein
MEQTECSETSAYKIQTPGNYPEENIQHTEHGESLKSRTDRMFLHRRSLEVRETQCSGFRIFVISHFNTILFDLFFMTGLDETGRINNEWRVGFPPLSCCLC